MDTHIRDHFQRKFHRIYGSPKSGKGWLLFVLLLMVLLLPSYYYLSSSPEIVPTVYEISSPTANMAENMPWPSYGQAAVGAQGYGVLATSNTNQQPLPAASVIKVLTALTILKAHPLALGESGPQITITEADVASFNDYNLRNGTVTKVVEGQQISQYQAMQAMLIRSANNMADTLAVWAYGSMDEYLSAANSLAAELGLPNTQVVDATGFSPQTVSTAEDLVKLGEYAMANPVMAEIVGTWQVELPEAGLITNTNLFLDFEGNGVVGIKTGDTEEAGGVYLVAAQYDIAGEQVLVIGALMAAPSHFAAQQDTMPLLTAARDSFQKIQIVTKGQPMGDYDLAWNGKVEALAHADLAILAWGSQKLNIDVLLKDYSARPVFRNRRVGQVSVSAGERKLSVPIELAQDIKPPSLQWRIKHILRII